MHDIFFRAIESGALAARRAMPASVLVPALGALAVTSRAATALTSRPDWVRSGFLEVDAPLRGSTFAYEEPFMKLRRFAGAPGRDVLIVAPMSGHYATLLREQVRDLLPFATVWVTEWSSASSVPARFGRFDMEAQVAAIGRALVAIGSPDVHAVAVCQPVPTLLAAASVSRARGERVFASLVLMGGPVDPAAAPTDVSLAGAALDAGWASAVLCRPAFVWDAGFGRRVYPGTTQIGAFIRMQPSRHVRAVLERSWTRGAEVDDGLGRFEAFYDEYLAVMDLPEEFYTQTLRRVFQRRDLALGRFYVDGKRVDPRALGPVPMAVFEGENDDVCAPGQCAPALDLAGSGAERLRVVVPGVGHYGLFAGHGWRERILPQMVAFWRRAEGQIWPCPDGLPTRRFTSLRREIRRYL